MEHNGSAILAMAGKDCVCIGSDLNFNTEYQHIGRAFKVYQITDRIMLGLAGLYSDCVTFYQLVKYHVSMLKLSENRTIEPKSFIALVAHLQYSKRYDFFPP